MPGKARKPRKHRVLLVEYDVPRLAGREALEMERAVRDAVTAAIHRHFRSLFPPDPVAQVPLETLTVSIPRGVNADNLRALTTYIRAFDADKDQQEFLREVYNRLLADIQASRPLGLGEVQR